MYGLRDDDRVGAYAQRRLAACAGIQRHWICVVHPFPHSSSCPDSICHVRQSRQNQNRIDRIAAVIDWDHCDLRRRMGDPSSVGVIGLLKASQRHVHQPSHFRPC